MQIDQIQPGDQVTVEYTTVSPFKAGRERRTVTVSDVSGQVLYTEPVLDGIRLIVDPDGRLWAREDGFCDDGLYGEHVEIEA